MSRIGRLSIKLPTGVTLKNENGDVTTNGPKGSLSFKIPTGIEINEEDGVIKVSNTSGPANNAYYGLTRALIANMVTGVSVGFEKKLEIVGVGYRASVQGNKMVLLMGYSHPVEIEAPAGISFAVEKNVVTVSGIDKQMVGEISARIRAVRPPEPYKGKGIRYEGEHVRRKAGKSAVKGAK